MTTIQEIKNRTIILDSNIPIHYAHAGFLERSGNPLRTLLDNGNTIGILPIVGFEILCDDNKEEVNKKYFKFLNYLPTLSMEPSVFQNAAVLAREYRRLFKGKKPPMADLLIGGFIATHSFGENKPLLFTSDRNDFCEPLWITIAYLPVSAETSSAIQEHLYLLELNIDILDPEVRKPAES